VTSAAAWRAALRIARRDAWRHRGRSALIIAMVLVPVFGLSCADVLARTMQLSPTEKVTRYIGHFDAGLTVVGGTIKQPADPFVSGYQTDSPPHYKGPGIPLSSDSAPYAAAKAQALALLHPTDVMTYGSSSILVKTRSGALYTGIETLDLRDPRSAGIASIDHGTAPANAAQAGITQRLADRLGLKIGSQLTLGGASRTVTAIVHQAVDPKLEGVLVLPGAVTLPRGSSETILVATAQPVSWPTVQQLDKLGVATASALVVAHPPKGIPAAFNSPGRLATADAVGVETVAVGMAILEVVLLAGAAFAVGVRRQRHDLALVSAVGGDASAIRAVVLGSGVLLGLTGAVLGIATGVALAPAALPFVARAAGRTPGHFDLRPLELLAVAILGGMTGLLAAWLPARTAARDDVVLGLTGRRRVLRAQKRVPVVGVGMIVAGLVIAVQATHHFHFRVILVGSVLSELGFVICAPTIIGLVGRLGRYVGLAPRLALRDAARHRGRSGPAIAAIMAGVAGAIAVSTYFSTGEHEDKINYLPSARIGQVTLDLYSKVSSARMPSVEASMRSDLDASSVTPMTTIQCVHLKHRCADVSGDSTGSGNTRIAIGGPDLLTTLLGHPDPAGAAALEAGQVVLFNKDPKSLRHENYLGIGVDAAHHQLQKVKHFNEFVGTKGASVSALVAPATVAKFPLKTAQEVLAVTNQIPTQSAVDRATLDLPLDSELNVGKPYSPGDISVGLLVLAVVASLVTLGSTAVAVGLSMAESKPDLMTLTAVGGRPLTRRLLVASQAGTIAVLGSAIGVVAGLIPAWAVLRALDKTAFQVPWSTVGLVVVAIPLLAMIVTAATSGSQLALDRRLT
jgi:putative ABC transport system permease protein